MTLKEINFKEYVDMITALNRVGIPARFNNGIQLKNLYEGANMTIQKPHLKVIYEGLEWSFNLLDPVSVQVLDQFLSFITLEGA